MTTKIKSPNILQRINAVMQEVRSVEKDADVGFGSNRYKAVSHDQVTAAVREPMVKHGIVSWTLDLDTQEEWRTFKGKNGERTEIFTKVWITQVFANIDDKDDCILVKSCGHGSDGNDKSFGKAFSYAVKYSYLKVFGLASGEDSDLYSSPQNEVSSAFEERTALTDMEKIDILEKMEKRNSREKLAKAFGQWPPVDNAGWHAARKALTSKNTSRSRSL